LRTSQLAHICTVASGYACSAKLIYDYFETFLKKTQQLKKSTKIACIYSMILKIKKTLEFLMWNVYHMCDVLTDIKFQDQLNKYWNNSLVSSKQMYFVHVCTTFKMVKFLLSLGKTFVMNYLLVVMPDLMV